MYRWWSLRTLYLHGGCTSGGVYVPCIYTEDVPLVEFMYLIFTRRMYLWWSLYTLYLHGGCTSGGVCAPCIYTEDVPLVEFVHLVFTRMPGKSYSRRLRSLLYLCYVFRVLINSLVC